MRAQESVSAAAACMLDITCSQDGRAHQIDDAALASAIADGSGRIPALCGQSIVAAAMATPPGPPCPHCSEARRATEPRRRSGSRGSRRVV